MKISFASALRLARSGRPFRIAERKFVAYRFTREYRRDGLRSRIVFVSSSRPFYVVLPSSSLSSRSLTIKTETSLPPFFASFTPREASVIRRSDEAIVATFGDNREAARRFAEAESESYASALPLFRKDLAETFGAFFESLGEIEKTLVVSDVADLAEEEGRSRDSAIAVFTNRIGGARNLENYASVLRAGAERKARILAKRGA